MNKHRGSTFDDFLEKEGILEECTQSAKDSVAYFMTKMTQEEFDTLRGDKQIVSHRFNRVKK